MWIRGVSVRSGGRGRLSLASAANRSEKTYALAAAREAWEQCGVPVCGAALSAIAARQLESATGIPSRTVAQLSAEIDQWDGLDAAWRGGVLVVDEGAMVGTRDLARPSRATACGLPSAHGTDYPRVRASET